MDSQELARIESGIEVHLQRLPLMTYEKGSLHLVHEGNHLVWRCGISGAFGKLGYSDMAIRMIHPGHYRAGEWLSAKREWTLLDANALRETGLAPAPLAYISGESTPPFVVMEWVDAYPLNSLGTEREQHLAPVANAIARFCKMGLTPEKFSFVPCVSGWRAEGNMTRYRRLLDMCRRRPRSYTAVWAARIFPVVARVHYELGKYRLLFKSEPWRLHHDGLHAGNVFIRKTDSSVVFLDFDNLSFRQNRVYTLARFAASLYPNGGIPRDVFSNLMRDFCAEFASADSLRLNIMAKCVLLERLCADLVYVPWDFVRNPANKGKRISDGMEGSLYSRLEGVREVLQWVRQLPVNPRDLL